MPGAAARAPGESGELVDAVGDRRILLLLDNLEHVLDAAAELATALDACPGLSVLATSREPLQVSAERQYPVGPLRLEP